MKDKEMEEVGYLNLDKITEARVKDNFLILTFINNKERTYNCKEEPYKTDFIKVKLANKFLVVRTEEYYKEMKTKI